jgi:hypothetical protein
MNKICVLLIIASFLTVPTSLCWADEKKEHICFRTVDSNQDDMVTFQEYKKYFGNDKAKFNQADLDKDGQLTHDEYHNLLGHGSS